MRILVATIVHHPEDARVWFRQITAMLDAGHVVTYIAPASDDPKEVEGLTRRVVPRARGRRRIAALLAARRALRTLSSQHDITIVHDPELLVLARSISGPRVWDVHEDLVAQIGDKDWLPRPLQPLVRWIAAQLVSFGARQFSCLIAESGYRERFPDATLVPNTVEVPAAVPDSGTDRVVYLGRVSVGRGASTLAALGSHFQGTIDIDVIGPIDAAAASLLAGIDGLTTHGFVPNETALPLAEGALAGLALLRDEPNYRHSLPTKVLEYMAHGVPVVTTPLPFASQIVSDHECGLVVPFDDPVAVAEAIQILHDDSELRGRLAANGRRAAFEHFNWSNDAVVLLEHLEFLTQTGR